MATSGGGVILHNASIDASGGDGPFAAYNASKAALLGLNRTMALELAALGIRSNCVSPGFTHTEMTEKAVGPELMAYLNGSLRACSDDSWPPTRRPRSRGSICASTAASPRTGSSSRRCPRNETSGSVDSESSAGRRTQAEPGA
jgi:NAD(P)-dependent dehydrogenase (short-subunit alcohol dehydrogenase family)